MSIHVKDRISWFLALISIMGFIGIFLKATFEWDIGAYQEPIIFLVLGAYLLIAGGVSLIFTYVKDGLTSTEMTKILAVFVGIASLFVGLLTLPQIGINALVFNGIKMIISGVAIIVIILEVLLPFVFKKE